MAWQNKDCKYVKKKKKDAMGWEIQFKFTVGCTRFFYLKDDGKST